VKMFGADLSRKRQCEDQLNREVTDGGLVVMWVKRGQNFTLSEILEPSGLRYLAGGENCARKKTARQKFPFAALQAD
jgi:hypothetical protein